MCDDAVEYQNSQYINAYIGKIKLRVLVCDDLQTIIISDRYLHFIKIFPRVSHRFGWCLGVGVANITIDDTYTDKEAVVEIWAMDSVDMLIGSSFVRS
jgi:hypothetical protein